MTPVAKKSILCTVTLACATMLAEGVQIRSYSAAAHDRFTGFPASPVINGSSFFDGNKVRGIGWRADQSQWQFTLVTRSHVLFATHAAPPIGSEIRFLNNAGQIVSRLTASNTVIKNDDGNPETVDLNSDLVLVTLNAPINLYDGISPLPYLDLPTNGAYLGKNLTVFGKTARVGKGVISGFTNISGSGLYPTLALRFDYDENGDPVDDAGDAKLETGDSGSPSLHQLASGQMSLVGVHSSIDADDDVTVQFNYDSFVPEYVDQIDAHLSTSGYRMTPVNTPSTTLSANETVITGNPRKGNPLSITLVLENTGANPTGNLEVDFQFAPGEEPDDISGTDWAAYGGGSDWTLRRSLLGASSSTTLTLFWSAAPLVEVLDYDIDWRSDKATGASLAPSHGLESSFNEWAAGLSFPGLMDDPDDDQCLNLSEYAFGSDPEDGGNRLPNGQAAQPKSSGSGNLVVLTFPERSDAASRGLSYLPEWSNDLNPMTWSPYPPAGLISSTSSYVPDVPGFVKRTLSWPSEEACQFVRIGILLNE